MKDQYDFSKGERGKLFRPNAELRVPIYMNADVEAYLAGLQKDELTVEVARRLLRLRFSEEDQARVQDLADRSQQGTLSEGDEREFDRYLRVGNLLAVMQSKARLVIGGPDASSSRS